MNPLIMSFLIAIFIPSFLSAQPIPEIVFLEELTWTEVRDAVQSGTTTIILPPGGTEQNGPHMVLGKHNYIIKHTAEQIPATRQYTGGSSNGLCT